MKKGYDTFNWKTEAKGVYEMCFSNEFSTLTHKIIYFNFMAGPEKPLQPGMEQAKAMTVVSISSVTVYKSIGL